MSSDDCCGVEPGLDCEQAREAYSARLDGELPTLEWRRAAHHIEGCAGCAAWCDSIDLLARRSRVRAAEIVPDLTANVLARVHPTSPGRNDWVRTALAVVGITQLLLALPALVMADPSDAPVHTARHLGAMTFALALGFVYCAWRPERAYGMVPVSAAMAGTLLLTAVIDVVRGSAPALGESTHLFELAGFALVWKLAGTPGLPRRRARSAMRRGPRRWAVDGSAGQAA